MKDLSRFWILLIILSALSCSRDDDATQTAPFVTQTINFSTIDQNEWNNNEKFMNYSNGAELVISSQVEWQNFEMSFDPGSNLFDPLNTSIDFSSEQVIVVINQAYTSAPSEAVKTNITEQTNEITIEVEYGGPGFAATPSHAHHIIKIPKQTKPFVFQ